MFKSDGKRFFKVITFVFTLVFSTSINVAYADTFTWRVLTSMASSQYWSAVASDNGSIMVASARGTYMVISTNSGTTWTSIPGTATGSYFLAMSKDGSKIFAAGNEGGYNYTSSDSGATWVSRSVGGTVMWRPCMSDDGQNILVPVSGGYPRLSTDGGATWSNVTALGSASWASCAMSLDGTKRYITNLSGLVARSSDSGATWQTSTPAASYWSDVRTSSDGSIVYLAGRVNKKIMKSTDYGQSFSLISSSLTLVEPYAMATSADGSKIVVFDYGSTMKSSIDGGATWSTEATAGSRNWYFGNMNSDGNLVVAPVALNGNYVYSTVYTAPTTLTLSAGRANQLSFRLPNVISATSNYPGKVTFYANGKRIGTCVSKPTVSLVASCTYKPTVKGAVTVTAKIVPTDSNYSTITVELFRSKVVQRTNTR